MSRPTRAVVGRGRIDGSPGAPRDDAWSALSEEIRSCRQCPLHATRTHAVAYRGSLTPTILFVGEAPGAAEDAAGLPFVGRSGRRLDAAVEHVGLRPEEYGMLNLLKCRPPNNAFDRAAAGTCRPYLDRQIALLAPRVLVPLGAHALRALAPDAPAILSAAGHPQPGTVPELFPLIHPAAALRSRRLAERWARDVDAFGRWLRGPRAQPV
ncbi:MAG: uracil-DNA glycosylase [Thermoplasmata archaeon]